MTRAEAARMERDRLLDQRFGNLTVKKYWVRENNQKRSMLFLWCLCDCGTEKEIMARSVKSGVTRSCGCLSVTHGMSGSQEYKIWRGMISRCTNPNVKRFDRYGGRGIKVCDRWRNSFLDFYADLGPRPSKRHSLEREEVNGDYEPGNVHWATPVEQVNNRRNTRYVVYRGTEMALTDAIRLAGSVVHREAAWIRISECGWSVEQAVETPRTKESPNSNARRARLLDARGA